MKVHLFRYIYLSNFFGGKVFCMYSSSISLYVLSLKAPSRVLINGIGRTSVQLENEEEDLLFTFVRGELAGWLRSTERQQQSKKSIHKTKVYSTPCMNIKHI